MDSEHLKILNLLPKRTGNDYIDACVDLGIEAERAARALGELMTQKFVDFSDNVFSLTEDGRKALENEKAKIDLSKLTLDALSKQNIGGVDWKGSKNLIHPALDFVDGVAYVTQWLPFRSEQSQDIKPALITSKHNMFALDALPEELRLRFNPFPSEGRWGLPSIEGFVKGELKAPEFLSVFDEVCSHLKYYMDLDEEPVYAFVALWVLGTYFHPLFYTYPYLFINAVKRSGKTKLLNLLSSLCFNAKPYIAVSTASVFRIIQGLRATLCIDEIEKVSKTERDDLRAIMLGGYKKGSLVPRAEERIFNVGERDKIKMKARVVEEYDVYSPKAMANIMGMERTLEDRCIPIILVRSDNKEILNRIVDMVDPKFLATRDNLYLLTMGRWHEMFKNYNFIRGIFAGERPVPADLAVLVDRIKTEVSSRHFELWIPVFSIAYTVSRALLEQMVEFAVAVTKQREQEEYEESFDNSLIQALIANCRENDWYKVADLVSEMKGYEGLEKISSYNLRHTLQRLKLSHDTKKESGRVWVFVDLERLKHVAKKFFIDFDKIRAEYAPEPSVPSLSHTDFFNYVINQLSKRRDLSDYMGFTKQEVLAKLKANGIPEEKAETMFAHALNESLIYEHMPGRFEKAVS